MCSWSLLTTAPGSSQTWLPPTQLHIHKLRIPTREYRLGLLEWGRSSDRPNLSTSCCLPVSRHQQLQVGKPKTWWGGVGWYSCPAQSVKQRALLIKLPAKGRMQCPAFAHGMTKLAAFQLEKIPIHFPALSFLQVCSASSARWSPSCWTRAPISCWDKVSHIHSPSQDTPVFLH